MFVHFLEYLFIENYLFKHKLRIINWNVDFCTAKKFIISKT